ncbi:unnamed protein product [Arabis nemorensis]|uniref:Uncharacterized protein n=1 Tax=Arabis nemorensis TaxID=586526 RepID=A0A565CQ95_9BRAS|nr:unnamed protein product [Arabis nemorensis]
MVEKWKFEVSYPFLPARCSDCNAFGHDTKDYSLRPSVSSATKRSTQRSRSRESRHGRRSRSGRNQAPKPIWKVVKKQEVPSTIASGVLVGETQGPEVGEDTTARNTSSSSPQVPVSSDNTSVSN